MNRNRANVNPVVKHVFTGPQIVARQALFDKAGSAAFRRAGSLAASKAAAPRFWGRAGQSITRNPWLLGGAIAATFAIFYLVYSGVQQASYDKWFLLVKDNFFPLTLILIAVVFLILSGKKGSR